MNLKVLLVAYKYPPYAGVGGYRWTKLAKYFARLGVEMHVVTVGWKQTSENTLLEDTNEENISIYRIGNLYPYNWNLQKFNSLFLRVFKYFFNRIINRSIFWDDEAQLWGIELIPFCEKLIRENHINTLIATGHPFQAIVHACKLKKRIPDLKFIADYRDPWFQHRINNLTRRRYLRLRSLMEEVLVEADLNVFVTQGLISEYLNHVNPNLIGSINVAHIPNGVDINPEHTMPFKLSYEYDFIHAGNITNGREEPLTRFLNSLQKIKPNSSVLLIGKVPEAIISAYKSSLNLVVSESISQAKVFELIRGCRYALHLNARHVPYSVSTKIYEYPALGRPTISINYGGEISELIKKHDLGFSINADSKSFDKELAEVLELKAPDVTFPASFYYESIAKNYLEHISSLNSNVS